MKTRLCSIIRIDDEEQEIYYEVDEEYSRYLCYEWADAFLVGFLPYAMAFNHDIKIDGEVSEKLYYQITKFLIPALSKFTNDYRNITITCGLNSKLYNTGGSVSTGFSGRIEKVNFILNNS